jgi:choline dehydrogenase-like flavoprotein
MGFDAIIVGSGATGSWAAKLLTEQGLAVVLLEAGPFAGNGGTDRNPEVGRQPVQSQCYAFNADTRHLFVDDVDNPYETAPGKPFVWIRMRQVGGRTALWHRVALRMSDRQFKAARVDGFGTNWPVSYADLQPYYDRVERFLGVSGIAANLEEIPDGPFLPASLSAPARDIKRAIEREWPERHVTALRRAEVTSPGCNPPCSAGVMLADAESTGKLTLRAHSVVSRVICDRSGRRALGVEYVDCNSGTAHEVHGKVILLCASTIETTRIMLNSRSASHPDGLGNSSGMLGQYLTEHISGVSATGFRNGDCAGVSELYIPNFRNRSGPRASFLRGYGTQGYLNPGPGDTTQCTLVCFGEMLPRATNSVVVGNMKDRWGIPVPRISCLFSDNELEMAHDQAEQAARMLRQCGFDVTGHSGPNPPGASIHEVGTARMGTDRGTSVLNSHNQCWDVANLFVTDGAAFPSVGFQNPTLTMMAMTGRACDYIVRQFRREDGF